MPVTTGNDLLARGDVPELGFSGADRWQLAVGLNATDENRIAITGGQCGRELPGTGSLRLLGITRISAQLRIAGRDPYRLPFQLLGLAQPPPSPA